ncbi:MAG: metallophosphoesterase [Clostridia bacterium]|nr:metallophosphoesterase [Clostridia bacterium]
MRNMKRALSVFLCIVIAFSCTGVAFAQDSWNAYWQSNSTDIEKGVYVAPGQTESERTIRWYTDSKDRNYVLLSESKDMSKAQQITANVTATPQGDYSAEAHITSLKEGTTYYYTCNSDGYKSAVYSITTSTRSEFSALYVTDVHISYDEENKDSIKNNSGKFASVISQAKEKSDISLILSTGDQASLGRRDEYCGYVSSADAKNTTVAILEGNHDRKNIDYRYFNANPETNDKGIKSYIGGDYWFVKGDTLFLVCDSNNADGVYHRRFIKNAIKANPDVKWRVAMFHHDLLGSRIPHRESENKLIRLLWMPLIDEFAIDLVLMGHSHYYTMSNVVYNKKTVTPIADINEVTDAKGSIYMVSGSINRPRSLDDGEIPPVGEHIGKYVDTENVIYNVLDFSENSIVIKSYYDGESTPFNEFTISKTTQQGGHPKRTFNPINNIVRFLGGVYSIFNNIGVRSDLKKKYDIKVPFFAGISGK